MRTLVENIPISGRSLKKLQDQQQKVHMDIATSDDGSTRPIRRRKSRDLESRLVRLPNEFLDGNRTTESYWNAIAFSAVNFAEPLFKVYFV